MITQINPTTFQAGDNSASVLIGGPGAAFSSEVRIERNGVFLNISHPDTPGPPAFVNDIVSRVAGNKTHRFEEILDPNPENSHLKYDIVFNSKPLENEVFNLDFTDGMEFDLQKSFIEQALDPDSFIHPNAVTFTETAALDSAGNILQSTAPVDPRIPRNLQVFRDDVVGSYAVTIQGDFGKNKLCHLFAHYLIDNLGNRLKVSQVIDPALKTLTVDLISASSWLDTAIYPVTLDPQIGYITAGVNTSSFQDDMTFRYMTPASSGTLTDFEVYVSRGDVGTTLATANLYTHVSDSDVGTTIQTTGEFSFTDTEGAHWFMLDYGGSGPSLTGSTSYHGAVAFENDTVLVYYDTGGTTSATSWRTITYGSPYTFPSPMTTESTSTVNISLRGNYTEIGGVGSKSHPLMGPLGGPLAGPIG